jgi:hypothetical protein
VLHSPLATAADDKPKAASFGKGKAKGPLLTRAELRQCFEQQKRIGDLSQEVGKLKASLDNDKAEVLKLSAALKEQVATLDKTNEEAVNAYNQQARTLDKRVDDYNAGTPVFNTKVDALEAERGVFAKACDNRNYDERDEIMLKRGK